MCLYKIDVESTCLRDMKVTPYFMLFTAWPSHIHVSTQVMGNFFGGLTKGSSPTIKI